jgi:hypothetical protein
MAAAYARRASIGGVGDPPWPVQGWPDLGRIYVRIDGHDGPRARRPRCDRRAALRRALEVTGQLARIPRRIVENDAYVS